MRLITKKESIVDLRVLTWMSIGKPLWMTESGLAIDDVAEGPTKDGTWRVSDCFERVMILVYSMRFLWVAMMSCRALRTDMGSTAAG